MLSIFRKSTAVGVAILIMAVLFCTVVAWQMIITGPFYWPLTQPATYQGGPEAVALIGLMAVLVRIRSQPIRWLAMLLLAELYLRRHAVDLPLLVDLIYLECVIGLGSALAQLNGSQAPNRTSEYLRCFVLGLAAWSAAAWTLSAAGYGSVRDLRWMSLLLFVPAVFARCRPLSVHLFTRANQLPAGSRMLVAALGAGLLVQFARSNVVSSFDALWYGLRGEYVLVGDGSAFEGLGLSSPVYYFPKMYELFLAPLAGTGDYSVLVGIGQGLLVLIGLAVNELLKELGLNDRFWRYCTIATCVTLPALLNVSLDPKPDVIAALLVMIVWLEGYRWLNGHREAWLWMIACGLLAIQAKLTAIPYLGLLGVAIVLVIAYRRRITAPSVEKSGSNPLRSGVAAVALAGVVAVLISVRTYKLTGMPTIGPDPLFHLWEMLGFQLDGPAGTLEWTKPQDWNDVPTLLLDWLFRPQNLSHIIITWVGNVWLWLPVSALLVTVFVGGRRQEIPACTLRWTGFALIAAGATLAVGWRYHVRGSDGNYFVMALLPGILLGSSALWRAVGNFSALHTASIASLLLFSGFQAGLSFLSAGWQSGTRGFDMDFTRSVRDSRQRNRHILESAGVSRISEYLRVQPGTARALGCMDFEIGTRLPARFEDLPSISYARADFTASQGSLEAYMRTYKIPFLILPKRAENHWKPTSDAPNGLCKPEAWSPGNVVRIIDDVGYVMYEINLNHDAPN